MKNFRITRTTGDLEDAFRLLYHHHSHAGLVEENESQVRLTPHHLLETTEGLLADRDWQSDEYGGPALNGLQ